MILAASKERLRKLVNFPVSGEGKGQRKIKGGFQAGLCQKRRNGVHKAQRAVHGLMGHLARDV